MDSFDLFIAGLIVFLVISLIFAVQKRYVVYFDGSDLFVSALTWLVVPGTYLFVNFLGLSETFASILLILAAIITVICFIASFVMCCHYNKSILAGLFVGIFKIIFAAFGLLLLVGMIFSAISDDRDNTNASGCLFLIFTIAFGLFGLLAKCMINGNAVYQNRQWTIQNEAHEEKNDDINSGDEDEEEDEEDDDDDNNDTEDGLDWAYEILEVSKDSSDEDIKQAYMKKIKESHPDKLPANTPEWIIKVAQEKFSKLQEAYKAICEAKKQ